MKTEFSYDYWGFISFGLYAFNVGVNESVFSARYNGFKCATFSLRLNSKLLTETLSSIIFYLTYMDVTHQSD